MEEGSRLIWHCLRGYWPHHLCRYGWSWCCSSKALFLIFCWWYLIPMCTHSLVHMGEWWARWNHRNVDHPTWRHCLWCTNCGGHSSWHGFMRCSPSSGFRQRLSVEAAQTRADTWHIYLFLCQQVCGSSRLCGCLLIIYNSLIYFISTYLLYIYLFTLTEVILDRDPLVTTWFPTPPPLVTAWIICIFIILLTALFSKQILRKKLLLTSLRESLSASRALKVGKKFLDFPDAPATSGKWQSWLDALKSA